MDGHIDTVDVIDRDQWTHDPFAAEIEDGKIYGRGTSDMKGSVCAMITAAAQYAEDTGKDFAGTICVSCTVHEECFEGVSSVRSAEMQSRILSLSAKPPLPRSRSDREDVPRWWLKQREKAATPPIRKRA